MGIGEGAALFSLFTAFLHSLWCDGQSVPF
uniref:Uncharacterized protein n=1 Tax=Rhizophora mucronata TaxID=61149 RepID=A0A2P2IMJ9_RHIMU